MGFSKQEYWIGLPFPPPGNLPRAGIEPSSVKSPALAGRFFITETPRKPHIEIYTDTTSSHAVLLCQPGDSLYQTVMSLSKIVV